jgi:hypothetical protein
MARTSTAHSRECVYASRAENINSRLSVPKRNVEFKLKTMSGYDIYVICYCVM